MSCDRATNNRHFDCPPLMADGRAFTDYRPKGLVAIEDIVTMHKGSYDLLQHFEANGVDLMDRERVETFQKNVCAPCLSDVQLRESSEVRCNANTCGAHETEQWGVPTLGQGRDYSIERPFSFEGSPDAQSGYRSLAAPLADGDRHMELVNRPPCARPVDPFNPFNLNLGERLPNPRG